MIEPLLDLWFICALIIGIETMIMTPIIGPWEIVFVLIASVIPIANVAAAISTLVNMVSYIEYLNKENYGLYELSIFSSAYQARIRATETGPSYPIN